MPAGTTRRSCSRQFPRPGKPASVTGRLLHSCVLCQLSCPVTQNCGMPTQPPDVRRPDAMSATSFAQQKNRAPLSGTQRTKGWTSPARLVHKPSMSRSKPILKSLAIMWATDAAERLVYNVCMPLDEYYDGDHPWDEKKEVKRTGMRRLCAVLFNNEGKPFQSWNASFDSTGKRTRTTVNHIE